MSACEWIDATSVQQAAQLLAGSHADHVVIAKAGGMDVLDLMKEGILRPTRLVNLKSIPKLESIEVDARGALQLGALTTLASISCNETIIRQWPALAQAAYHAATPQVRNVASIGGNLLQRPRCWYFRNALLHSTTSNWTDAQTQYHGIFDNARNPMVHASTPATALLAYDASVHLVDSRGRSRALKLGDFLLPPDASRRHDAAIEPDEVITRISVPAPLPGTRSSYHKQTERESYDWPICDVVVVLTMTGETVTNAVISMGWVAPTPRRATTSEQFLTGQVLNESTAAQAAAHAVMGATPFAKNRYKVQVLETVVRRTLLACISRDSARPE